MSVIALVIILLFLGVILWAVNTKAPGLHPTLRLLINIVVIAVAVLLVLSAFGVWDQVRNVQVPKI